ncbi:receptor-like cytosolic serine/threonine-protein kinase RBK2 isoform X2 [Salvia miltiorrhiza]|uniref:receptor-like cytosolic serine/threonine-protein kinase RBK2 isoform X2 n=1 Tax=Salvia miltiorrhiza TaxID=226208 RepID=UPI0025ABEE9F|nr:receptor-like cytosolic serine/threonine-protein kinase RBK2 isoform X2 [Salvia miltiorrhiza]
MADQNSQEIVPLRRKHEKTNSIGNKTYQKFAFSFPCSTSAQDLKAYDTEQKDTNNEIVKYDTENEAETEKPPIKKGRSHSSKISWGWRRFVKLWKKSPIKKLPLAVPKVVSKRISRSSRQNSLDIDTCPFNYTWKTFTYAQLKAATNNFSPENLIGKGGYSEVYKGCLPNEQCVAIKRLNKGVPEEDVFNFLSEIGIIAHLNHPNTAKMVGYGVEGGAFLVLQLSSLGSLGAMLHNSDTKLEWSKRYKIMLGVAEGLHYLHECCERRIIHRDIKADNVLLSEDFEPQICDFGLSKWLPKHWSHHNATKFEGTFGYFAPEYFMHGIVDEKIDIFSFGVLLLELITGRQALDESKNSLVLWAKPLLDKNAVSELVDPCLENEYIEEQMGWVISTATMCIQQSPVLRPRMSRVTGLLRGENDEKRESPKGKKQSSSHQRTYSEELSYVEEYNSTKCLIHPNNKHDHFQSQS